MCRSRQPNSSGGATHPAVPEVSKPTRVRLGSRSVSTRLLLPLWTTDNGNVLPPACRMESSASGWMRHVRSGATDRLPGAASQKSSPRRCARPRHGVAQQNQHGRLESAASPGNGVAPRPNAFAALPVPTRSLNLFGLVRRVSLHRICSTVFLVVRRAMRVWLVRRVSLHRICSTVFLVVRRAMRVCAWARGSLHRICSTAFHRISKVEDAADELGSEDVGEGEARRHVFEDVGTN